MDIGAFGKGNGKQGKGTHGKGKGKGKQGQQRQQGRDKSKDKDKNKDRLNVGIVESADTTRRLLEQEEHQQRLFERKAQIQECNGRSQS